MHSSRLLDTIAVHDLAEQAKQIMQESQAHLYSRVHLPIWGVTRANTVALQFAPQHGKPKKIQIRFRDDADSVAVVDLLEQLGVYLERRQGRPGTGSTLPQSAGHGQMATPMPSPRQQQVPMSRPYVQPLGVGGLSRPATASVAAPKYGQVSNTGLGSHASPRPQTVNTESSLHMTAEHSSTLRPQTGSSSTYSAASGDRSMLPSEALSKIIPPVRPLPPGFPSRPSSSNEQVNTSNGKGRGPASTSARPSTRSRTNTKTTTAQASKMLQKQRAAITKTPLELSTAPRLDPPRMPTSYMFRPDQLGLDHTRPLSPAATIYTDAPSSPGTMSPGHHASSPDSRGLSMHHSDFLHDHDPDSTAQQLANYGAQSDTDRAAALDRFIVENMQNDAFLKLCEDVEGCWRRIGLGM